MDLTSALGGVEKDEAKHIVRYFVVSGKMAKLIG